MSARLTEIPRRHLADLKRKGMTIDDEDSAAQALEFISYYRLQAYWEEFLVDRNAAHDGEEYKYREGTRFEDGLTLYRFDRDLRLIVLDAVERLEVAIRSMWEMQMSTYGWHAYHMKFDIYQSQGIINGYVRKLKGAYKRYLRQEDLALSRERWAKNTKDGLPVVWVAAEIMDFGSLMDWIEQTNETDQMEIASSLRLNAFELVKVGRHLTLVRNVCAHHNSLWNRTLKLDKSQTKALPDIGCLPEHIGQSMAGAEKFKLHNTLVLLYHLLSIIKAGEEQQWRDRIVSLIDREPLKPACLKDPSDDWIPSRMGFPANWRTRPVWQASPQPSSQP